MSQLDYFTTKLPAETRVLIYEFLFSDSRYARRQSGDRTPIAAIISTCTLISTEALDAFYNLKTVRLMVYQLRKALSSKTFCRHVREVQIYGSYDPDESRSLHRVIRQALRLPKLRSLIIALDILADPDDFDTAILPPPNEGSMFIDDFAAEMDFGKLTCFGVGRYHPTTVWSWVSHTSFPVWLALLQATIDLPHNDDWWQRGLDAYLNCVIFAPDPRRTPPVPLHGLSLETVDEKELSYWSNIFAFKLTRSVVTVGRPQEDRQDVRQIYWPEIDGRDPIGLVKSREVRSSDAALEG
ncbi:hypothetical protein LTR78_003112 [Recurvomyces mirabilis]|uniref:Uncharacterized protein n=1 Tax=Recurvomyces mirabilis TaxID=574656 RepID=A0AAE1C3L6_9PEZI|nr:hypothetical protein LTR78_003112 [Recurvomyces mirabilis]KAK5157066.1 hypothetical protein LTS14_004584 [Recurvomyces mirabilis]